MRDLLPAERQDFIRALDYAEGQIDGFFATPDAEVRVEELPAGQTFPTRQVQEWGGTIAMSWGFWQWRSGRSAWPGYPLSHLATWLERLERVYIEMARVKAGIDRAPGLSRAAAARRDVLQPVEPAGGKRALPLPVHATHPRIQRYVAALKHITGTHDSARRLESPPADSDYDRELRACTREHFPPRFVFDPFRTNTALDREHALRTVAALAGGVKVIQDVAYSPNLPAEPDGSDPAWGDVFARTRDCVAALAEIRKRFHPGAKIADIDEGPAEYAERVHACLSEHFPPRVSVEGLLEEVVRYRERVAALVGRGNVAAGDVEEMTHRTNHALFWMHYLGALRTFEPVKWVEPAGVADRFAHLGAILGKLVTAQSAGD
jgi:hypothetical protein